MARRSLPPENGILIFPARGVCAQLEAGGFF
jgi:hypothetical protein